jgi:hypothetical protein
MSGAFPHPPTPLAPDLFAYKNIFRTRGLKPQQPPALMLGSFLCSFQFDKAGVQFLDSPGRREAVWAHLGIGHISWTISVGSHTARKTQPRL